MSFLLQLPGKLLSTLSPARKRSRASDSTLPPHPAPDSPSYSKRQRTARENARASRLTVSATSDTSVDMEDISDDQGILETIEDGDCDGDDGMSDEYTGEPANDEDEQSVASESETTDFEGTTLVEYKTPEVHERVPTARLPTEYTKKELHALRETRAQREAAVKALQGWSPADKQLKNKLNMRGLEPLLPKYMEVDFYSFPTALFARDERHAYIVSSGRRGGMTDKAQSARLLRDLVELGQHVRTKVYARKSPEWIMRKRFETYIKWSLKDACLWQKKGVYPLVDITSGSKTVSVLELQRRTVKKLSDLARQWRHSLDPKALQRDGIPPLYGIVISYTLMAIVSYVPDGTGQHPEDSPANYLRQIGTYRFHDAGHDVWNAFAVAILVMHCRNSLLRLLDSGSLVDYDGTGAVEEEDPDAPP